MSKPFILCFIDDRVYKYTVTHSIKAHNLAKRVFSDWE